MLGAALRFTLTGGAATLVHLAVAVLLMRLGIPPLFSNAVAFLVAFLVSFWGHHLFTFAGHGTGARRALFRFVFVAGLGFITNETCLVLLLKLASGPVEIALLISTSTAAIATFMLSRCWAFKLKRPSVW